LTLWDEKFEQNSNPKQQTEQQSETTTLLARSSHEALLNAVYMLCSGDIDVNATSVQGGNT